MSFFFLAFDCAYTHTHIHLTHFIFVGFYGFVFHPGGVCLATRGEEGILSNFFLTNVGPVAHSLH